MLALGVDLGIRKIAISVIEDGKLLTTMAFTHPGGMRWQELNECAEQLYRYVSLYEPDLVCIEETLVGNNVKYSISLAQMMGAVLLGLGQYEELLGVKMPQIVLANVSKWKKEITGNGRATKEIVRDALNELDSAYPVLCGYDQDRIDAACIGLYGYRLHQRAEKLASSNT